MSPSTKASVGLGLGLTALKVGLSVYMYRRIKKLEAKVEAERNQRERQ